jgi:ArsR family metal-binding transcriptional regulator
MLLESVKVLDVDICIQQQDKFAARTRASTDLSAILPYLNAIFKGADYNREADSLTFIHGTIEFSLIKDQVNVKKFANRTELHELLDWIRDLVNDIWESRSELTPMYAKRRRPPVMTILSLLPRTNCGKCGEKSCMAFAARLYKMEVKVGGCPYLDAAGRNKLEIDFE